MKRDAFQGIADSTRREILNMIALKSLNVNSVASNFEVSRTAIYKHLKILSECGLIEIKQQGRERYCEVRPDKLNEVADWLEQYLKVCTTRLDSLENYLNKLQSKTKIRKLKTKKKKNVTRKPTKK